MADTKIEPNARERAIAGAIITHAGGFIDSTDVAAQAIADYRAELARDAGFILSAAEALLREAGVCKVDLPALTSAPVECKGLSTGEWVSAPSLAEACAKAKATDPFATLASTKERGDG